MTTTKHNLSTDSSVDSLITGVHRNSKASSWLRWLNFLEQRQGKSGGDLEVSRPRHQGRRVTYARRAGAANTI